VQECLSDMISLRIVEPYDVSVSVLSDNQKLAITYKGIAHYELSTKNSVYFYQMALTTGITDPETVYNIRNRYKSNRPFGEITSYVRNQFSTYLIREDEKFVSSDQGKEQFECQRDLIRQIRHFGIDKIGTPSDEVVNLYNKKLIGKVSRYDFEKDYGFIYIQEIGHDVYFKIPAIQSNSMGTIYEFDVVYCTLDQGERGALVKSIDGFVDGLNELISETCVIKNYNQTRGFGFACMGKSSSEAFFHKSAFPRNFHDHLKVGLEFEAEIRMKDDGRFHIRRCVDIAP
jgi:cold shock CspA family protein